MFLLIWATHLVGQGFERAFGPNLRQIIGAGTRNRFIAFLSGLGVTALLQSSTATALLLVSFAKRGLLTLTASLAVMLGADISTTLIAQVLSFNLSWLSPVLIVVGVFIFIRAKTKDKQRQIGFIITGLGLMLLSLALIREAASPLQTSGILPVVLEPLERDPFFAILVSAIFTWVLHSSLAAVLLFASLAQAGIFDLDLALLFILGANIGGALVPYAVTFKEGPIAQRITLGNISMRFATSMIALLFLDDITAYISALPLDTGHQIVTFHTGFNVALGLIFFPFIGVLAQLLQKIVPTKDEPNDASRPLYLDRDVLDSPATVLANATRESLRVAELVEDMLEQTIVAFKKNDRDLVRDIRTADHLVDALYKEIKLYMAELAVDELEDDDEERYFQILTFATNLEHIGDIIDKSLMELAKKKIRKQERFSDEGFKEIKQFHELVLKNMRIAQAVFVSGDIKLSKQLAANKWAIRTAADTTFKQHFKRLEAGTSDSIATSSLHLDIIRDYRQINNYATRVAYMILDHADEL